MYMVANKKAEYKMAKMKLNLTGVNLLYFILRHKAMRTMKARI